MGTLLMMFANKIVRKANQIRKQNWSAPSVMSAFIIFCMFMVYSFETIGILNIDFRITTPETNIKTYNKINKISSNVINFSGEIISDKLKNFSEKNREENLEKIRQIMLDGAMEQIQLESCTEIEESENENGNKKPEAMLEFFDV